MAPLWPQHLFLYSPGTSFSYVHLLIALYLNHVSVGDVLVILDLRPDNSLFEAGVAREVIVIRSICIGFLPV